MDFLHACDLGVTSDWLGSLLFYLQNEKIRGHSKRIRCAKLYQNIKAYYDRVTDRLPKLLPTMLREKDRGKIKSPKLRAKAGEARALVGAALELATKYLSPANPAEEAMLRGTEALQSMYACLSMSQHCSLGQGRLQRVFSEISIILGQPRDLLRRGQNL